MCSPLISRSFIYSCKSELIYIYYMSNYNLFFIKNVYWELMHTVAYSCLKRETREAIDK